MALSAPLPSRACPPAQSVRLAASATPCNRRQSSLPPLPGAGGVQRGGAIRGHHGIQLQRVCAQAAWPPPRQPGARQGAHAAWSMLGNTSLSREVLPSMQTLCKHLAGLLAASLHAHYALLIVASSSGGNETLPEAPLALAPVLCRDHSAMMCCRASITRTGRKRRRAGRRRWQTTHGSGKRFGGRHHHGRGQPGAEHLSSRTTSARPAC